MKKTILLFLLTLVMGGLAIAQLPGAKRAASDLTAKVPIDKKVRIGHLDNGFTYYIRANKKPENRVQFRLVSNAGSILEDDVQQGLAHFCEHMAFNGIEGYPHNTLIEELQRNGIEFGRGINAWTSFDETVYYVEMPSDKPEMVEMGFKILNGWAGNLLFDPQELEDERGVIHEEWRGSQGAGERLRAKTWPIMLKDSRYAQRLPIGTEEVIMGFKRDDIVRFFHDWYRPDLQALVIVGDINVDEMEAKIKEYFAGHAKVENPKTREEYTVPDNKEPLIAIATDKEATSAHASVYWKHPKAHTGLVGDYRTSLVRSLASGMLDARMDELYTKASAPMTTAGAGYGGFLSRSLEAFIISAGPKENRIDESLEAVLTEAYRAAKFGFLQTELDRQKEAILSAYTRMAKEENKTPNNSFAQEYTNHYLEGEVIPGIRQEWQYAKEFLPTITLEEVNAMMASWVRDENVVFYITAPEQDGYKVPTEADVLNIFNRVKTAELTQWVDNYKDEPFFDKELPAATAKVTKTDNALGFTEYTCPNGIRFVVKKTELKADEIQVRSFGFGGSSLYEDKDIYNVSSAAGFIDDAGIAQFDATQLSKKLKGVQIGLSPSIGNLSQGFTGSSTPKDFEMLLQYLYHFYNNPRYDQESFDKNIEKIRSQVKYAKENPQTVFVEKFYNTIYPDTKRIIIIPSEEQINGLNLDKMHSVYRERFADASNQTFFFVGNVGDTLIPLIAKYLNALPVNGKQAKETWKKRDIKFVKGTPKIVVEKGLDNQGTLIVYGETTGFKPTQMNRMIVSQLNDAVDITAIQIIREKMGGTYSPSVNISCEILPEGKFTWMFYIQCDPEKADTITEVILSIVKDYMTNGPDAETLAKVQEQMIINRGTAMQNNGFWLGQIFNTYFYNENFDHNATIEAYTKRVKSVTAKDIQQMAKKYFNLKNYAVAQLRPEKQN